MKVEANFAWPGYRNVEIELTGKARVYTVHIKSASEGEITLKMGKKDLLRLSDLIRASDEPGWKGLPGLSGFPNTPPQRYDMDRNKALSLSVVPLREQWRYWQNEHDRYVKQMTTGGLTHIEGREQEWEAHASRIKAKAQYYLDAIKEVRAIMEMPN